MAPPPTHIPFLRTDGSSVCIAWFDVSVVRPDPNDATACYVYDSHGAPNTDPWHIAASAASVVNDLHLASGLLDTPISPFALLATVDGVQIYAAGRNVPSVRADVNDPLRSYLFLSAQKVAFHLNDSAINVCAALTAADPDAGQYGGAAAGGPGSILALATVLGDGTIPPGGSFGPLLAGPYLPASGNYSFTVPVLPPGSLIALVTQLQNPALDIVFGADCGTPGYVNVSGRTIGGGPWADLAFQLAVFRVV